MGGLHMCADPEFAEANDEAAVILQIRCAEALVYAMRYQLAIAMSKSAPHVPARSATDTTETEDTFKAARDALEIACGRCDGRHALPAYRLFISLMCARVGIISHDVAASTQTSAKKKELLDAAKTAVEELPLRGREEALLEIKRAEEPTFYESVSTSEKMMVFRAIGLMSNNGSASAGNHWYVYVCVCVYGNGQY